LILIITSELGHPNDLKELDAGLQAFGPSIRFMNCSWLVSTDRTPQEVAEGLRRYVATEEFLFVAELSSRFAPYLPKRAANWIEKQRRQERDQAPNVYIIEKSSRSEPRNAVSMLMLKKNWPFAQAAKVSMIPRIESLAQSKRGSPMILIVLFELKPARDFAPLQKILECFGPTLHFLPSFCLTCSDKPPVELAAVLRAQLTPTENVFVSKLVDHAPDYLPRQAVRWIAAQETELRAASLSSGY
jgi:hypothetical protein